MGGPGSGRRRNGEEHEDEASVAKREAVLLAARASPELVQILIEKGKTGSLVAINSVLDRGMGKPASSLEISGSVTHLVLTPEQYALLSDAVDTEWKQIA